MCMAIDVEVVILNMVGGPRSLFVNVTRRVVSACD